MMMSKEVSVVGVMAWLGWSFGVLSTVLELLYPDRGFTAVTTLFVGGAAVLHIRMFVARLEWQERNAFELGRDSERSVRSLR